MIRAYKKKLQSNRGASMMLAMALLLVCVMVSSVILAAATAGASRNAKRIEQQQGYLAISSASNLLIKELEKIGTYVGKNITGRYGCHDCNVDGYIQYNGQLVYGVRLDAEYTTNLVDEDYEAHPLDDGHLLIQKEHTPYVYAYSDEAQSTLNGMFGELFHRACNQVFVTGLDYEEDITLALSKEDDRMPDVLCHFSMSKDYSVRFELTTEVSEYTLSITMDATEQSNKLPDETDTTDIHTIYYKKYHTETGIYTTEKEEWAIPIEVSTVIKRVTWEVPQIEKGGLSQ